jgi:hypothetical protein
MAFDWGKYLELAEILKGLGNSNPQRDECLRSATSRAYYAAFCYARNFARDNEEFHPAYTAEDHKEVRRYYQSRKPLIARGLSSLRGNRNLCDYQDSVGNLSRIVEDSISEADAIIKSL